MGVRVSVSVNVSECECEYEAGQRRKQRQCYNQRPKAEVEQKQRERQRRGRSKGIFCFLYLALNGPQDFGVCTGAQRINASLKRRPVAGPTRATFACPTCMTITTTTSNHKSNAEHMPCDAVLAYPQQ
jgi:hypothetical protein